jgi:hypothetical protein
MSTSRFVRDVGPPKEETPFEKHRWRYLSDPGIEFNTPDCDAALEARFAVQPRADQPDSRGFVGEDADLLGGALDLLVEPFERVGAVQFAAVRLGKLKIGGYRQPSASSRGTRLRGAMVNPRHAPLSGLFAGSQGPLHEH